jgi:hypothetical protein
MKVRKALRRAIKIARHAVAASPLAVVGTRLAYAAAADPDRLPYDLSFVRNSVSVVGMSMAAWLAARRSKAAIPVGVVTTVVMAGLSALQVKKHGKYVTSAWPEGAVREKVFNEILPPVQAGLGLAGIAGLAAGAPALADAAKAAIPQAIKSKWPAFRRLGLYYMVFCMLGHWAEIGFVESIRLGLVDGEYDRSNHMLFDQWLFPFPAEGSAAVLMALLLHPAKLLIHGRMRERAEKGIIHELAVLPLSLAETFIVNQVVCTAIDYTTGMVANRNYELWDYRGMPFNFQGQICLQNSLFYTTIATWAAWHLFPLMERGLEAAGDTRLDGAFVGLGSFFLMLLLTYHVLPPGSGQGTIWDDNA